MILITRSKVHVLFLQCGLDFTLIFIYLGLNAMSFVVKTLLEVQLTCNFSPFFWLKGGGGPRSPRIFLKIFYTHRTLQNQKSKNLKQK
jgi:hypothetical protein